MEISTTTTITLTEADICEAVKQYIQSNGFELEDKDVEFVSELPQEVIVKVDEATANQTKMKHIQSPVSTQEQAVDCSMAEDLFTPSSTDSKEVVCQKPRGWNPFRDDSQGDNDQVISHAKQSNGGVIEKGTIASNLVHENIMKRNQLFK
ncbi:MULTISPECIES: hypothetical protein [unclassified Acinetobacter]|jgi:glutaredoxin|uniref:hypothetical protein n=1 Tax=unclassified Acinetobacter TaxID=196816 RepID=UPI0015D108C6|nr:MULTISPECIES: hypothetical protein [unclassified Acinetobacter]